MAKINKNEWIPITILPNNYRLVHYRTPNKYVQMNQPYNYKRRVKCYHPDNIIPNQDVIIESGYGYSNETIMWKKNQVFHDRLIVLKPYYDAYRIKVRLEKEGIDGYISMSKLLTEIYDNRNPDLVGDWTFRNYYQQIEIIKV